MLGRKAYVLDSCQLMWHNGYRWVDLEPEDDMDFAGALTVKSEGDLPSV